MVWKLGSAAAVLFALAAIIVALTSPLPESGGGGRLSRTTTDRHSTPEPVDTLRPQTTGPSARVDRATAQQPEEESEASGSGVLRMQLVGTPTGELLHDVEARFASESRYAEPQLGGAVELLLSPSVYRGALFARGRDPVEIAAFEILAGGTTDLGVVSLARGEAAIEGCVRRPSGEAGTIQVRLEGEGRNPCPSCSWEQEAPCSECGFAKEGTTVAVTPEGRFRFTRLAAGTFDLRALGGEAHPFGEIRRVVLAPRQWTWIELGFEEECKLVCELRNPWGHPFDGTWTEGDAEHREDIVLHFFRDGEEIGMETIHPPVPRATATNLALESLVLTNVRYRAVFDASRDLRIYIQPREVRFDSRIILDAPVLHVGRITSFEIVMVNPEPRAVDRPRTSQDSLDRVPPPPPRLTNIPVRSNALTTGVHEVGPLPPGELMIWAECGPFESERIVVHLSPWDTERVLIPLARRDPE